MAANDPYEIYPEKFLSKTWLLLQKSRLEGELLANSDYPMSTPWGLTVMSILADSCAGTARVRVTDRGEAYATLAGILGNRSGNAPTDGTTSQEKLVAISLEVIDVRATDLKRLIEFRKRAEKESGKDRAAARVEEKRFQTFGG